MCGPDSTHKEARLRKLKRASCFRTSVNRLTVVSYPGDKANYQVLNAAGENISDLVNEVISMEARRFAQHSPPPGLRQALKERRTRQL